LIVSYLKLFLAKTAERLMIYRLVSTVVCLFVFVCHATAQQNNTVANTEETAAGEHSYTLTDCLKYALKNQPVLKQSSIDEQIARKNNAIALSGWLPQVNGSANFQHYFQVPTAFSVVNGVLTPVNSGVYNYSLPQITATQTIFNTDVMLAIRAAKLSEEQVHQVTTGTKINLVSAVSKAFYDLLLSIEQIDVYKEDTARLKKNQSDAYNRFVSGVVDKVDYKQATISLNNSMSQLKNASETVGAKYAMLKQLMGYPAEQTFAVRFDTAQMMQEIIADTVARLQFERRIEYQQLETARRIQHETTRYYELGFLPSLSGFYNYVHEFENPKFNDMYSNAYPYSSIGLQLNIPLFTGFKRTQNVRKARLEEQRTDWDVVNLKLAIYTEYKQALANYKSNLYDLRSQRDNVQMAREVYDIVKLQYSEGIKAYLDVIVAESALQNSEINYLEALFHLLESKIDLEKAMGDIPGDI
jgi:outer membrane protein TolC